MRTRRVVLVASLALLTTTFVPRALVAQSAVLTALRFGALVDRGETLADAVVVVQGDTIVSVGSGPDAIPSGAWVVDLRPYTAIPGLIDVHTHMTYWRDEVNAPRGPSPRSPDSVIVAASENAMRTLRTGVTTVRDLGASRGTDVRMRDAIESGAIVGPRMFVAGQGLSKRAGDTTAVDFEAAIRARVEAGADWIKMYGSTGSYENVTGLQTFSDEEMRRAVQVAHGFGKRIAIHSYGASGARGALLAGAESIEHAAGVDDETLAEWARRGTFYVPTIDHNRFYAENASLLGYDPREVMALDSFRALNLDTARRAHMAGVRFAMGSDAVYWMFGENTDELAWFVEAGMTPAEALETATTNAAELLGMAHRLGRIAPGYLADIVAVEGDPLQDVRAVIEGVRWVMKGGAVVVDELAPALGSRGGRDLSGVARRGTARLGSGRLLPRLIGAADQEPTDRRKDVQSPRKAFPCLPALLLAACAPAATEYPTTLDMTTWSVVGVDPVTGDVGVAVASCVARNGDAVAALVPGMGAAATQASFDVRNRNRVYEAIQEGLTAEEVIARVTDPAWDAETDRRQYGVVTMHDGFVRAAGFTTPVRQGTVTQDDGTVRYAGWMADASMGVSAQGNTLASHQVVQAPLDAYRWDDPAGFNRLSDRLMRALEAGSRAGGDVRCNEGSVRQTASMAAILVARGGDAPYAAENIGMTDAGTPNAPWLALSVVTERLAENPLIELRRQYDRWRRTIEK